MKKAGYILKRNGVYKENGFRESPLSPDSKILP
jgi:hypothetical protein